MAILNKKDKVICEIIDSECFTYKMEYPIHNINRKNIIIKDNRGISHVFDVNIFMSSFSLPIKLQNTKEEEDIRSYNVGESDYSKHKIQPWDIILEYALNYWDGDIIKRILRKKATDSRKLDYEKIIHICKERIRQVDAGYE